MEQYTVGLTASELGKKTGKHPAWISKISREIVAAGHGIRAGSTTIFYESAVDYIISRPETRGRKKKNL